MSDKAILILDLGVARQMSESLYAALGAALNSGMRVQRESVGCYEGELRDAEVRSLLQTSVPDLVFLLVPSSQAGTEAPLFEMLNVPVIVAPEAAQPEHMLALLELGAADFISPPFNAINILPRVWRILAHVRRRHSTKASVRQKLGLSQIVGTSPGFVKEVNRIPLVAGCDATVLILGETGTGKELFARAIHYLGPRASKPFVAVNCGAIPPELVENELFGHERGAYTGAFAAKAGLVAEADGGTLFLDEVDCLPPMAQVKLLRFIQEKEYRPLGSTRTQLADLRIVAASNCDLTSAVENGRVRRDLYYRLNILPFNLPALRERREDIPLLAARFISKYSAEFDKDFTGFEPGAMHALLSYDWPGNVRELEHVIERVVVLSAGPIVQRGDIPIASSNQSAGYSFHEAKARLIDQFEKGYIRSVLLAHGGNITRAAQAAGKNRRAFFELIRKHQIDVQSLKARA